MKKFTLTLLFILAIRISGICNVIDDVWQALEKHDRKTARSLLTAAIKDPAIYRAIAPQGRHPATA